MAPTLQAEEFQYLDTGILINGGATVPFLDLTQISGLDSTDLRQSSHDREGLDGGYIDALYEGMRTVSLDGTLYASTTAFETFVDQLKANFAPSAVGQPLYFGTDAGVRVVYGKSLGFKYDKTTLRRIGSCAFQVQVVCEDPRIYTPGTVSAQASLPTTIATGRGYPKSYTYGYGPSSGSTTLLLTLDGNRNEPGLIRVYGPINNPTITNLDDGTVFYLNMNIANGDYVEINLNNKTVKLNGITSVRSKLSVLNGAWYLLHPGANNFTFAGGSTLSGTTKLIVSANTGAWR